MAEISIMMRRMILGDEDMVSAGVLHSTKTPLIRNGAGYHRLIGVLLESKTPAIWLLW
jgi:hypothetical protein